MASVVAWLIARSTVPSVLFYGRVIPRCVHAPHLLYPSSTDGHLRGLRVLAVADNAAVNTEARGSLQMSVGDFFG